MEAAGGDVDDARGAAGRHEKRGEMPEDVASAAAVVADVDDEAFCIGLAGDGEGRGDERACEWIMRTRSPSTTARARTIEMGQAKTDED